MIQCRPNVWLLTGILTSSCWKYTNWEVADCNTRRIAKRPIIARLSNNSLNHSSANGRECPNQGHWDFHMRFYVQETLPIKKKGQKNFMLMLMCSFVKWPGPSLALGKSSAISKVKEVQCFAWQTALSMTTWKRLSDRKQKRSTEPFSSNKDENSSRTQCVSTHEKFAKCVCKIWFSI